MGSPSFILWFWLGSVCHLPFGLVWWSWGLWVVVRWQPQFEALRADLDLDLQWCHVIPAAMLVAIIAPLNELCGPHEVPGWFITGVRAIF